MAEYEKKVRDILRQHGCTFVRHGKGDHDIWYSPIVGKSLPVDSKIKSRHTANGIMKQSGIDYRFYPPELHIDNFRVPGYNENVGKCESRPAATKAAPPEGTIFRGSLVIHVRLIKPRAVIAATFRPATFKCSRQLRLPKRKG